MKYIGTIKNIKGETIEAVIITNNDSTQTTELTLAGESPIIITQTSSDGLFSPIKSRSCTITIVSKEIYFDMYSGSSHGTSVTVNNLTQGECIFFGYLTPCEYNQPLLYLNEIELEAVDAVSTLQDFKYQFDNNTATIKTIKDIVIHCLKDVGGYTGKIMVPISGLRNPTSINGSGNYSFEIEYINEEMFFDGKDYFNCYEVLEEICKTYCFSLVPFGEDVYFIDYEAISKYGNNISINISWSDDYLYDENLLWKDLVLDATEEKNIEKLLTKTDYAGEDQNLEIDEVYNKIIIKADVDEVDDDDIICDPFDYADKSTYYTFSHQGPWQTSDGLKKTFYMRFFELNNSLNSGDIKLNGEWKTTMYNNSATYGSNKYLLNNFTQECSSFTEGVQDFKYTGFGGGSMFSGLFTGQTCVPTQVFNTDNNKPDPGKVDWSNVLIFTPQVNWLQEYFNGTGFAIPSDTSLENYWYGELYENHLGGTNPVLTYESKNNIYYSPSENTVDNYLIFDGNLLWEIAGKYGHFNVGLEDMWYGSDPNATNQGEHYPRYSCMLPTLKDLGCNDNINAASRGTSDGNYNKGWNMLKVKLSIGDRYWNGNVWTTTESTFYIPYHKEDVKTEDETLIYGDYNKPVCNFTYWSNINESDGYAIPLFHRNSMGYFKGDQWAPLCGKLKISIYMPKIPYVNGCLHSLGNNRFNVNYEKTPPLIRMKNFSLKMISVKNENYFWGTFEDKNNDDIIYSNTINTNNVVEFSDLDLKISSYNDKKKMAKSYILYYSSNGPITCKKFWNPLKFHFVYGQTEYADGSDEHIENLLLEKYTEHYSNPKKIYNCIVHGYYEPWKCVRPSALNNLRMIIDEQEYDVKADTNELKLIEY